jgi:hypothetical protein
MKKTKTSFMIAFSISILLSSCSVNHSLQSDDLMHFKQSEQMDRDNYVKFKDGHVLQCQTLVLKKGFLTTPYLLADGWYKIKAKDVERYQMDGKLAVSGTNIKDDVNSQVAIDALPGFAVRLVSGSMNVYQRSIFNGRSVFTRYYIQRGENGPIVKYSPETLKKMVEEQNSMKLAVNPSGKSTDMGIYLNLLSQRIDSDWLTDLN